MKFKQNYIWPILAAIPAALVLFFILYWQPNYGLMDDSLHVYDLLPKIRELGIIKASLNYCHNDLKQGFIRFTYPLMVWAIYGAGREFNPTLTFALDWLYVVLLCFYFSYLFQKILQIPRWILFAAPFAFFYFHDLFLSPSLQEKNLLLFGCTLIFLCSNACKLPDRKRIPLILLTALLGGVSKTQFVIFFLPSSMLLFWSWKTEKKSLRFFIPFGFFVLITIGLGIAAALGTYNGGRHSISKALTNLFSFQAFYLSAPIFLSLLWVKNGWNKIGINYFIPASCLIGFFLVFLPWGIEAYVQGVVLFFVSAALAQFIYFSPASQKIKTMGYLLLVLAAITVTTYRSNRNFTRLADLRDTIHYLVVNNPQLPIYANCPEGHKSIERFIQHNGNQSIHVDYWLAVTKRANHFLFVGDTALCPLINAIDGCTSKNLEVGHFPQSFQVVEWRCGS